MFNPFKTFTAQLLELQALREQVQNMKKELDDMRWINNQLLVEKSADAQRMRIDCLLKANLWDGIAVIGVRLKSGGHQVPDVEVYQNMSLSLAAPILDRAKAIIAAHKHKDLPPPPLNSTDWQ